MHRKPRKNEKLSQSFIALDASEWACSRSPPTPAARTDSRDRKLNQIMREATFALATEREKMARNKPTRKIAPHWFRRLRESLSRCLRALHDVSIEEEKWRNLILSFFYFFARMRSARAGTAWVGSVKLVNIIGSSESRSPCRRFARNKANKEKKSFPQHEWHFRNTTQRRRRRQKWNET